MAPVSPATGFLLTVLGLPVQVLRGLRVLTWTSLVSTVLHATSLPFLPSVSWPWLVLALLVFVTPVGKMAVTVLLARLLLLGVRPGDHPRGGSVHVRVWLAERIAEAVDGPSTAGAPWISYYARALGARIGRDVDLHALPPVTGMLRVGARASIEPEVDLAGHWVDGDVFRLGPVRVDADAVVRSRSTLLPGAHVGAGAEVEPGSSVTGRVPDGERWAGSPAERVGSARHDREARPASRRRWLVAYGVGSVAVAGLPVVGVAAGLAVTAALVGAAPSSGRRCCVRSRWCRSRRSSPGSCTHCWWSRRCGCSGWGCTRDGTRCGAGSAGRCGRPSGCSTLRGRCSSRCTPRS